MKHLIFLLVLSLSLFSCGSKNEKQAETTLLQQLDKQLAYFADKSNHPSEVARSFENGEYRMASMKDWTCGFSPGSMWYMYELTGGEKWKKIADEYTWKIDGFQYRTNSHDLGFMSMCSFGNAYRLTGDEKYKQVILQASESLITRFNENVGSIRSWDHGDWDFPVIIYDVSRESINYNRKKAGKLLKQSLS